MSTASLSGVLSFFTACTMLAGAAGAAPDPKALATALVNQSAGVRENDIVLIDGGIRDQELLENIAAMVGRAGGFPLVTFASDKMDRMLYEATPAKYDSRPSAIGLKLAETANVSIVIDHAENPALFADVPPERAAARAKAGTAVLDTMLKRGVRQVSLGNGLYPTEATASQFGITKDQLAQIFWAGVNSDPANLQSVGDRVKQTLATGKSVTITNPNGTNLTVGINGRTPYVSDGVISAEDVKKGGAACQVWLPAGEVYTSTVPGSAEGTIVADRVRYQGKEILGLTLTVKAGKVTAMTAKSGIESLQAFYGAAAPGKEAVSFIDIGINPDVKVPAGSKMVAWMPAGMITVGIGNNVWAGGDNNCNFDIPCFLPGSTVTIDGKTVIDAGTLKQ